MELTQLQYFLEVAQSGHLTASAEKLHIAQPALSATIHRLESDLGVKLFAKSGRNIVLTPCGKYLLSELQPVMAKLGSLPAALHRLGEENLRTVRLNVLAASAVVTEAIIEFRKQHPDAVFLVSQTENGEPCDVEVFTKLFYQKSERDYVIREEIFLAVPKGGRYADVSAVALRDLEHEGFLCLSGSRQFRTVCDKLCAAVGFRPDVVFESDSPATVQNMIHANLGVGFWPAKSWGEADPDRIRLLPITDPVCCRELILRAARDLNPTAEAFFSFLCRYIESK